MPAALRVSNCAVSHCQNLAKMKKEHRKIVDIEIVVSKLREILILKIFILFRIKTSYKKNNQRRF